jgi:hypothetical protein
MPIENNPLQRECRVFTLYLIGKAPSPYVIAKYEDAHQKRQTLAATSKFDRFLVGFAAAGPGYSKLADSYARLFAPLSTLRKKLVLLLAILESSSSSYQSLENTEAGGSALLILRILLRMAVFAFCFALGAIVLLPAQMILHLVEPAPRGSS